MQKKPLEWSAKATSELIRAVGFYTEEASELVANHFLETVEKATKLIAANPLQYREGKKSGTREYVMRRFPYTLVFTVNREHIAIIRLAHQSMRYFN